MLQKEKGTNELHFLEQNFSDKKRKIIKEIKGNFLNYDTVLFKWQLTDVR